VSACERDGIENKEKTEADIVDVNIDVVVVSLLLSLEIPALQQRKADTRQVNKQAFKNT